MRKSRIQEKRGFVLVAVVIVVSLLALSAYSLTNWLSIEAETAELEVRLTQNRLLAESAVSLIDAMAASGFVSRDDARWTESPELFEGLVVFGDEDTANGGDQIKDVGRVSVFSPLSEDAASKAAAPGPDTLVRFGVEREGGKIHVNAWFAKDQGALQQALRKLPGATNELVDATLDWLDTDDEPRASGAERDVYEKLPVPMSCRNGPIESVGELMQVRGMTPEILYGEDTNGNGRLDPNENDGEKSPPLDNQDGKLDRGWAAYLTIHSREANADALGRPRIFLNDPDLGLLFSRVQIEFGEEMARFIVAYRVVGPAGAMDSMAPPSAEVGRFRFNSVLDLVDATVNGVFENDPVNLTSPLRSGDMVSLERLPMVLDRMTASPDKEFIGRLDLAAATPESLAVLTSLSDAERLALSESKPPAPAPSSGGFDEKSPPLTLAWLLSSQTMTRDRLIALERDITVSSPVLRVRAVGFRDAGRAASLGEWVVDASQRPVRVLDTRSIDRFGSPIPLPALGQGADMKKPPSLDKNSSGKSVPQDTDS